MSVSSQRGKRRQWFCLSGERQVSPMEKQRVWKSLKAQAPEVAEQVAEIPFADITKSFREAECECEGECVCSWEPEFWLSPDKELVR